MQSFKGRVISMVNVNLTNQSVNMNLFDYETYEMHTNSDFGFPFIT